MYSTSCVKEWSRSTPPYRSINMGLVQVIYCVRGDILCCVVSEVISVSSKSHTSPVTTILGMLCKMGGSGDMYIPTPLYFPDLSPGSLPPISESRSKRNPSPACGKVEASCQLVSSWLPYEFTGSRRFERKAVDRHFIQSQKGPL